MLIRLAMTLTTCFQSTPPRRRRRNYQVGITDEEIFNPRLREGGDFYSQELFLLRISFQSTPPRRRRRLTVVFRCGSRTVFNPRLREGGDCIDCICTYNHNFSIHASAKEATLTPTDVNTFSPVFSIHASAKEATTRCCTVVAD